MLHGRFSPDMRHIAYITDQEENGKLQLYVRPFDAAKPESPPPGAVVQVSADAAGMIGWRQDGREMYFLQPDPQNADVHVMAVDVATTPTFKAGTPRLLFKLPGPGAGKPPAVEEREQRRPAFRVRGQRSLRGALRLADRRMLVRRVARLAVRAVSRAGQPSVAATGFHEIRNDGVQRGAATTAKPKSAFSMTFWQRSHQYSPSAIADGSYSTALCTATVGGSERALAPAPIPIQPQPALSPPLPKPAESNPSLNRPERGDSIADPSECRSPVLAEM